LKVSPSDNGPAHDPDQKVLDLYGNLVTRSEFERRWAEYDDRDLRDWHQSHKSSALGGVLRRWREVDPCTRCGGHDCLVTVAYTYVACQKDCYDGLHTVWVGKEPLFGIHPLDNEPALFVHGQPLMPRHLADLRKSGLTDDTI
jgi:hypothetical protein